jgi:hypothetical protein
MNETSGTYSPSTPQDIFRLKQLATDAVNDLSGMVIPKRVFRKRATMASIKFKSS